MVLVNKEAQLRPGGSGGVQCGAGVAWVWLGVPSSLSVPSEPLRVLSVLAGWVSSQHGGLKSVARRARGLCVLWGKLASSYRSHRASPLPHSTGYKCVINCSE